MSSSAHAAGWVLLALLFLLPFYCWIGWNISKVLLGV